MRAPLSGFPTSQRQIIGPSSSGAQCLENHSCLKAPGWEEGELLRREWAGPGTTDLRVRGLSRGTNNVVLFSLRMAHPTPIKMNLQHQELRS